MCATKGGEGGDVRKATGPDNVSPRIVKHSASKLTGALSQVFTACLEENSVWREAQVVAVHKRSVRTEP